MFIAQWYRFPVVVTPQYVCSVGDHNNKWLDFYNNEVQRLIYSEEMVKTSFASAEEICYLRQSLAWWKE